MNGPVSRLSRLACPHTNCQPGTPECERREAAELAGLGSSPHPTARHDEMPDRYVFKLSTVETVNIREAVERVRLAGELLVQIEADARRQLLGQVGQDRLFGGQGQRAAMWRRLNPGMAAWLDRLDAAAARAES